MSPQCFKINPNPHFIFELNCLVFGYEKPMPEVYEGNVWRRAIRLDSGRLTPVALLSLGTIEEPKIGVKCFFQTITEQEKKELDARALPNEKVMETLKRFRGVGTWTAEMVLCAGLKRKDCIPAGDLGVRRTFSRFYSNGGILSEIKVRRLAENWGEFTKNIVYCLACAERV